MINISAGFITNSFTSAFNIYNDTLRINNIDLGVPVDNISINPNDSYINQNTKFGSVKVLWPHLSLTGDIQLFLRYVTQTQVEAIERAAGAQDTNMYVSFAGYMYRTEHIDYTIKPNDTNPALLDMTLSMYGVLPYSTPVFRPKFSTLMDEGRLAMSSTIAVSNVKGISYSILPLPGISVRTREDTLALLTLKADNTVAYSIFSDIRNFSTGTTGAVNAMSNNTDQHYSQVSGLVKSSDGEDVLVSAKVSGNNILLTKYTFKYTSNAVSLTATNLPTINPGVMISSMYFKDNRLYVWGTSGGGMQLIAFDILSNNAREDIVDTSNIHRTVPGVTTFPSFTHKFNTVYTYGLQDKSMFTVVNNLTDVNSYNTYVFPKGVFNNIIGINHTQMTGILHVMKLEDNKLLVFPKGLTVTPTDSLLYAVVNFKNYNEKQNQYTNPAITAYKTGKTLTDYSQLFVTHGYIQVNTALISGNSMHMTTEAYTDYYKEDNIVAMTLSTSQNKYYVIDLGSTVEARVLTK